MFSLRLQTIPTGPTGGRPQVTPQAISDNTNALPFEGGDLDLSDSLGEANDAARSTTPDDAVLLEQTVNPSPVVRTEGTNPSRSEVDAQLSQACNRLNNAQREMHVAQTATGVDTTHARAEIQNDLQVARGLLREATHPPGRQGVQGTYRITTELHPQGVSVAQIQQRLRTLEGDIARLPPNNLVAAAGVEPTSSNSTDAANSHVVLERAVFTRREDMTTEQLRAAQELLIPPSAPPPAAPVAPAAVQPSTRPAPQSVDELMNRIVDNDPAPTVRQQAAPVQTRPAAPVVVSQAVPRPNFPSIPVGVRNDMSMANDRVTDAEGASGVASALDHFVGQAQLYIPRAIQTFNAFCSEKNLNDNSRILFEASPPVVRTVGEIRSELNSYNSRLSRLAALQ